MNAQNQNRTSQFGTADDVALPADQRLTNWHAYARQRQAVALDRVKARLLEPASGGGLSTEALQQALRRQLGSGLIHDLTQDCADWRGEKASAIVPDQLAVIEVALGEHLAHLIPSDACTSTAGTGAQRYRWLIPSLGGGLLGLLLLGPDGIGGTLGALLGAAGGIAGVAWLANHPEALNHPSRAAAWSRFTWLQGPGHWLLRKAQRLARRLAAGLVDLVLPPPLITTASLPQSSIAPVCERAFDLLTTLVFLRCTACADCGTPASHDDTDLPITEASVLRALLRLVRTLDWQPTDTETVCDVAEDLRQRLQESDYVWELLPDGTLFQEEHRQRFHIFGLVAPGEPVETLEPCFRRGETILLPGRITKQRG